MHRSHCRSRFNSIAVTTLLGLAACGGPATMVEKTLTVGLTLSGKALTVTAKDGEVPVMTDVWLYTLHDGTMTALTGFQDPDSKRRYRGLMLPCALAGAPSHLAPCDNGELNGVMTDLIIDTLEPGTMTRKTAIDGTVAITLSAAPTDTIVVVVAREDERYAGAAAITPAGQAAEAPAGVGVPETHAIVTYSRQVKSIIDARCITCHAPGRTADGFPLMTYDNVVNNNFGYTESATQCNSATPGDQAKIDTCLAAITKTEYMIDPGNPALSTMLRRTRPDEDKSMSSMGLTWWGSRGARFGGTGDRRMPATNTTADLSDDVAGPTYFDMNPAEYQLLWDWVAQGAPK